MLQLPEVYSTLRVMGTSRPGSGTSYTGSWTCFRVPDPLKVVRDPRRFGLHIRDPDLCVQAARTRCLSTGCRNTTLLHIPEGQLECQYGIRA